MPQRKEEDGHWSQSRDEHTIQVLVFLLEGKFQQENVLGVQEACMGRCFIRLQVIVGSLSNSNMFQIFSSFFTDMGWSVSSDSTVMDWKRNSDQIFTETSKQKHWEILNLVNCMDWKSSGPSWNTTGKDWCAKQTKNTNLNCSNANELDVDAKLKSQLEQFHSIEDFKVLYPQVIFKFSND